MCHDWLQFCSQKRICPLETPYYYDSVLISFSYTYTFWRWLLLLVLNDKPKTTSLTKRNDIQPIYFIRVLCTRVKYVDINWSYIIRPIHSYWFQYLSCFSLNWLRYTCFCKYPCCDTGIPGLLNLDLALQLNQWRITDAEHSTAHLFSNQMWESKLSGFT